MEDEASDSDKQEDGDRGDPLLVAIGSRIREVRGLKGRGVTEAATLAGLGKGHLWRIEAGKQNFSVKILARIATALDVTLSGLMDGVTPAGDLAPRAQDVVPDGEARPPRQRRRPAAEQ